MYQQLGLDAGKLVFKACDQVRLKPAFSATESSLICFLYVLTLIFGDSLSIINFSKIYCSAYIVFSSVFLFKEANDFHILFFECMHKWQPGNYGRHPLCHHQYGAYQKLQRKSSHHYCKHSALCQQKADVCLNDTNSLQRTQLIHLIILLRI